MAYWDNYFTNTLRGYGYSVEMPFGFSAMPTDPISGGYFAWPTGSAPPPNPSPALIWMLPIMPMAVPGLLQQYYDFDNPMVATFNANTLGLMSVLGVAPLRQTNLNGAVAHVREFDAMSLWQQPMRMSAIVLQGPASTIQCVVGINLYRWVEFAGAALQFVARIQLDGVNIAPGNVRTVIDRNNLNQVEMQIVNAGNSVAPIMSLPTSVGGQPIFHIEVAAGASITFGAVSGTNVQIGDHNIVQGPGRV